MIVFWIALFFALACLLAWLVLFAEGREWVWRWLQARTQSVAGKSKRTAGHVGKRIAAAGARLNPAWLTHIIQTHHRLLLAACVLIILPPLLIFGLRRNVVLEGFDGIQTPIASARIEQLLRGERLIPPPPPPPEVFMTAEVEAERPMTATADRKWDRLDADFTQRLLAVYRVMRETHGYEMVLIEGYRSPERQNQLAARGKQVTRARAGQSWHQYGLAADSAFLRDGKLVISERDPWAMRGYQLYGQVAKEAGLVWGGDWRSIKDLMHVELRRKGVIRH